MQGFATLKYMYMLIEHYPFMQDPYERKLGGLTHHSGT